MPGTLSGCEFDVEKETEGEWWVNYRDLGFDIKVAHYLNENHRAVLLRLYTEARKGLPDGAEVDDFALETSAMAEAIWVDARHLTNDDGTPREYTLELGIATLANPNFSRLRNDIQNRAQQDEQYLVRAVGNSEPASAGS